MWEEFHLKWLEDGNEILVVIFEMLTKGLINQTLEDVSEFLNFELDRKRLSCTVKYSEGSFRRKEKCFKKRVPILPNNNLAKDDSLMSNASSMYENYTNDIFTIRQKTTINLAILNVNQAIIKRGFSPLPISDYQSTVIRLGLCL
jgi:hypothetical protein